MIPPPTELEPTIIQPLLYIAIYFLAEIDSPHAVRESCIHLIFRKHNYMYMASITIIASSITMSYTMIIIYTTSTELNYLCHMMGLPSIHGSRQSYQNKPKTCCGQTVPKINHIL